MTDSEKPSPSPTDAGWDTPANEPVDPDTGYVMHPADPRYAAAMDPISGLPSSGLDPVTGLPVPPKPDPDDAPILPAAPPPPLATVAFDTKTQSKPKKAKKHRDDDGDSGDPDDPRRIRLHWVVAGAIVVAITIITLVFLGRENSSHYYVQCDSDKIVATRGRSFPPWGTTSLTGVEWKAIPIAPNDECTPTDSDNIAELEDYFLKVLMRQASALLQAKEVTKPDVAAEQLNQALLLARSEARRPQRRDIERLLGDVEYWRASTHLKEASTALLEAAKQFDAAAAQQPRHVADAASWAKYIRGLVDKLQAGPSSKLSPDPANVSDGETRPGHEPVPAGTALPVTPDSPTKAPVTQPAVSPSGGVLL